MDALGREIAERREALGMSQTALGKIARCSREAISNLELGKVAKPRTDMIVAIADFLGLHENMLRTRGLDVAADALITRRGRLVDAAGLESVAQRLTEGVSMTIRRVGDVYAISLPDTDMHDRPESDANTTLRGKRRKTA